MKNKEMRVLGEVHVRSETQDEGMVVEGYAMKFNTWSVELRNSQYGNFKETIEKDAFKGADLSDIPVLVNHDANLIVGRSTNESTELSVDDKGLYFKVKLPKTTVGRDLYENVKVGNINKCSFSFTVKQGGITRGKDEEGNAVQSIKSIDKVLDISLVTYPAYKDTNVGVARRSLEQFEEELKINRSSDIKNKLMSIKLEMLREEVEDEY